MSTKMPSRPELCLGWVTAFLWPAPVFIVLFLLRALIENSSALMLGAGFVIIAGLTVIVESVHVVFKWLVGRSAGAYDCPLCGHDICQTPHRCPQCGTRLIWGHLPGPGDRRLQLVASAEQARRLAV
jgi:predicted RNA-binding Zn-ribbon protein involved in translation (DUF1610 family)